MYTLKAERNMKAIVFDFNGTLFFDTDKNYEAWTVYSETLRGTRLNEQELNFLKGANNRSTLEYIKGRKISDQEYEEWSEGKEVVYRKLCKEDTSTFHLAPGAIDLLNFLKDKNIPRGIASMAGEGNFKFYIENFSLLNFFDREHIVYDDGKIPGKPDPTIYLTAFRKLNINPKDCVVVEDSVPGIESAYRAGAGMIISLGHQNDFADLCSKYGVHSNINDFRDFDTSIFH